MPNPASLNPNVDGSPCVIRMKTVVQRTGLSRATIYRLMATNQFPRSFKIGTTASGWLEAEVRAWIHERASSRRSAGNHAYQTAA